MRYEVDGAQLGYAPPPDIHCVSAQGRLTTANSHVLKFWFRLAYIRDWRAWCRVVESSVGTPAPCQGTVLPASSSGASLVSELACETATPSAAVGAHPGCPYGPTPRGLQSLQPATGSRTRNVALNGAVNVLLGADQILKSMIVTT